MLAESDDLTYLGWIKQARGKKLDLALNRAGSLSFSIPITDPMAYDIFGQEVKRCVIAFCDDVNGNPVARWSGPIWTTTAELSSNSPTLNVNCVGWFELLAHREFKAESIFTSLDAGEIANRIIRDANSTSYLTNLINNFSFENGASGWVNTNYTSPDRDNTYSFLGGYAAKLTATGAGTKTFDSGFISVTGNSSWTASIDSNTTSVGSSSTVLVIRWYDAAQAFISSSVSSGSISSIGVSRLSFTATSPANAAYAIVRVQSSVTSGTVTLYIDNAIFVSGSSTGITTTPITIGSVDTSQTRTITFPKGTKHSAAIETLVNMESGFDFNIDPLSRQLSVYYDLIKGTVRGRGTDQTDVIFGYGKSPKNISQVSVNVDSSILTNKINANGKFATGIAVDAGSVATYGLFEDSVSLSDVTDTSILTAFAGAEVAYKLQPFKTYSFTPFPYDGTSRIPLFFEDYDIGDIVYLNAEYGAVSVQGQAVRVFGVSIDIDEEGNEKIGQLQTVSS